MPKYVLLINNEPWRIGERVIHKELGIGVITGFRVASSTDARPFKVDFVGALPCQYYGPKSTDESRRITRAEPAKAEAHVTYPENGEVFGRKVSVPIGVLISTLSVILDGTTDPDTTNFDLPANFIKDMMARIQDIRPWAADYYLKYLGELLNGDRPTT